MRTKEIRPEKKQLVADLAQLITSSEAMFLVTYKGLKVTDFSELRARLADLQSECHVVPNRLFQRAAAECGLDSVALDGDSAMITGGKDAAAVAKAVKKFSADHDALQVKIGALNGQLLNPEEIDQLAKLPAREIMLAQLLGVLQGPSRQVAGVLYNRLASIVYALNAYYTNRSEQ